MRWCADGEFLWPPCVADADIIFLSCTSFFCLSFPRISQPSQIVCLPYFHTWCGLSANVRCSSETCCTGLAEIQDAKKSPKITIWATSHNLSGYIFATAARIDNRKNLSNSSMFSRCRHNIVNFGPLAAEVSSGVWGTPTNFNVTARQSSSERQPNFAALNRGRHLCSEGRPSGWALAHILVLLSFFSSPNLSGRPYIGCLPYFHKWCGLSANLRCRSETRCTGLAEIQDAKKSPKIAIWAPSHNFVGPYLCN